jgi:hypothetical protein
MARDFLNETEFGLPVLTDPFGNPIAEGTSGAGATITGLTDADAIKNGAGSTDGNHLFVMGAELREIYATGEGGILGPKEPKAGTS